MNAPTNSRAAAWIRCAVAAPRCRTERDRGKAMRQIVLDTETTGLDWRNGDRDIEIGCVELLNRSLTGSHFHVYINPERSIDAEAVAVHRITDELRAHQPQ